MQVARPPGDRRRRCVGIEAEVVVGDVGEHRRRPCLLDGLDRGDERERRHDHLVARLHPEGEQREAERVEPVRDADRDPAAAVGGELLLELRHVGAVRVRVRVDQAADRVEQLGLQRVVRRPQVEERDGRRLHRSS